ncbi:MAG: DMT family transporter [Desulfobulbia bacterium]
MSNLIYIAAAVVMGVAHSLQPPINAYMARGLGSPLLAASISIFISFVIVTFLWLTWGRGAGDFSQIIMLPWWVIIGGIVGVVFVVGSVVVAPVLGVALFFVCVVAGQLIGSTLLDQFGFLGLTVKPLNMMKLIGIGLVVLGAALVQSSNS